MTWLQATVSKIDTRRYVSAITQWRIGKKVLVSYGAVAAAIAVLAIVAAGSLLITRSTVSKVTSLADAARSLSRAETATLQAQNGIKDFVISNRPLGILVVGVKEQLDSAGESIAAAREGAEIIGEGKTLAEIDRLRVEYRKLFEEILAAQNDITYGIDERLDVTGPAIGTALHTIMVSNYEAGNNTAAYRTSLAIERYSMLRINVNRYLASTSNDLVEAAKSDLLDLETALNDVFDATTDKALTEQADAVIVSLVEYDKAFKDIVRHTARRDVAVEQMLTRTGPAFAASIRKMADKLGGQQKMASLAADAAALGAIVITLIAAAAGLVVTVIAGALTNTLIAVPINRMAGAMLALSQGETDTVIEGAGRHDEVGDMARAVAVFKDNAAEVEQRRNAALEHERREREREAAASSEREAARTRAAAERRTIMTELADAFETSVQHVVTAVGSAARQIAAGSQQVSDAAARSGTLVVDVAASAEEASHNALTVANASEEMARSLAEVSH